MSLTRPVGSPPLKMIDGLTSPYPFSYCLPPSGPHTRPRVGNTAGTVVVPTVEVVLVREVVVVLIVEVVEVVDLGVDVVVDW